MTFIFSKQSKSINFLLLHVYYNNKMVTGSSFCMFGFTISCISLNNSLYVSLAFKSWSSFLHDRYKCCSPRKYWSGFHKLERHKVDIFFSFYLAHFFSVFSAMLFFIKCLIFNIKVHIYLFHIIKCSNKVCKTNFLIHLDNSRICLVCLLYVC